MKRICMYTPPSSGGMALYAWELATAMARHPRANLRIDMVTEQGLLPQFRSEDYDVHPILPALRHRSSFPNRLSWAASRLTHYWRRERCFLRWLAAQGDVTTVHFQEWTPWLAPWLVRQVQRLGKRAFYTVHNIHPHNYPRFLPKRSIDAWIRRAYGRCDGLFVHTDRLRRELADYLGERRPPIHVMPHGVWTVRTPADAPPLAQRLPEKKLLFFGSIRRNKGLHLLLDAAELLPDYTITIAGEAREPGYVQTEIRPRLAKLKAAGARIEFIERFLPDEQVGPLLAQHGSVILPYTSQFVAQSGVIFMALAHEVPVVASEVGGLGDVFARFKVGQTFAEPTPQALAAAIRQLHERTAAETLANQIAAAKERFSWREAASATLAGYADLETQPQTGINDSAIPTTAAR